jgi:hypothetical protein
MTCSFTVISNTNIPVGKNSEAGMTTATTYKALKTCVLITKDAIISYDKSSRVHNNNKAIYESIYVQL